MNNLNNLCWHDSLGSKCFHELFHTRRPIMIHWSIEAGILDKTNLDQIPLKGFRQLVQVEVPGDGTRVLVAPPRLGDHLHVVVQGCQASGVQLPEGAQIGADDVGDLGPNLIENILALGLAWKWLEIHFWWFCKRCNVQTTNLCQCSQCRES